MQNHRGGGGQHPLTLNGDLVAAREASMPRSNRAAAQCWRAPLEQHDVPQPPRGEAVDPSSPAQLSRNRVDRKFINIMWIPL